MKPRLRLPILYSQGSNIIRFNWNCRISICWICISPDSYLLDDIILFALAYFITELFNPYPVDLIQNYSSLTQTQLNLATQQLSTFLSLLLLIKTLLDWDISSYVKAVDSVKQLAWQ